ncbi:4Fe-4S binding domain-containing protein [Betaproteobacteria bacterium]|nr:4Fe-4S binding domain-containing protein [Betaproteobacteria bacterium]
MSNEAILHFHPRVPTSSAATSPARSRLERLGLFLRHQRKSIIAIQWAVVLFYSALVVLPAFFPLPASDAHLWNNLRLCAQFIFWGIWWPGVMLTTVAFGRVWCGYFCPEGFLSELASRHGRGKPVPAWLKWSGWPFFAFVATTVYGQLSSVYEYSEAALLVLGGSTVAAVIIGFLYGRDKRVWCHYLCPASGVFAVLAKLAPLHYKVDREAWDQTHPEPFNCPPLVDVRRMVSASDCHACSRCAGQRDAVTLAPRSPFDEILDRSTPARTVDAFTLLFGVLGLATVAFQWTVSPWFRALKMNTATWLVDHGHYALLADNAPWWLLTHYPEANDVFTWLDGLMVLTYLVPGGALLGGLLLIGPYLAARLLRAPGLNWQRWALTLTPLGAASVILGLTMTTATQLRGEHLLLTWLPYARALLLAAGCGFSLWIAFRLAQSCGKKLQACAAWLAMCLPAGLMAALWGMAFFVW